jgi:pimeloyl-ACP methyl ester carboxylesterase
MAKLFIHGVPDSPAIWRPLLRCLDSSDAETPSLPGFDAAPPAGFGATKDEYAAWLEAEAERAHAAGGPVDIVGHDWGALLTLRVVSLRPELFRTWAVSNAVIDPDYRGHLMARCWNTPVVGELLMAGTRAWSLERALRGGGIPADVARDEAECWRRGTMQPCILRLYRSADGLRFAGPWVDDLENLPPRGLLMQGCDDPYVHISVARRFSERRGVPLHEIEGAGHWAIAERPAEVARLLTRHWAGA